MESFACLTSIHLKMKGTRALQSLSPDYGLFGIIQMSSIEAVIIIPFPFREFASEGQAKRGIVSHFAICC